MPVFLRKATQDKRIHVKLNMDMLDPESMRDEMAFEGAMGLLESHLANPAVDTQKLLQDILSLPRLLELFISGMFNFLSQAMRPSHDFF